MPVPVESEPKNKPKQEPTIRAIKQINKIITTATQPPAAMAAINPFTAAMVALTAAIVTRTAALTPAIVAFAVALAGLCGFLCRFCSGLRCLGCLLCSLCRALGSFDTFSAILHTFHRTAGGFYCFLRFSFDRLGSGIFGPYFRSGILRDLRCFAASVFRFREGTGNFSFFFDFPSGGLRQFFPAPIGNVGTLFAVVSIPDSI